MCDALGSPESPIQTQARRSRALDAAARLHQGRGHQVEVAVRTIVVAQAFEAYLTTGQLTEVAALGLDAIGDDEHD